MADVVLESTHFEGNTRLLSSSATRYLSSWEYSSRAQAKPPGQHTQPQANTYVTDKLISILLEILTSGHLSSWQYLPQETRLFTSADWVAREHGHPRAHPAGICFHPISRTSPHHAHCSMTRQHIAGCQLCMGACHQMVTGTTLPSLFSFWDDPLLTKGVVPPNGIVVPPQTSRLTR
ncbi:hypothetical protein DPMN_050897 [Dreissena polymorpha]|uniref:Uncharacterized protein n=1 Tax=Dreissena polymorpha TaxID=45954 RepID=A0A9D4HPQ8_DREPO|nr:hypothetical protein DPMN_050897 [Dreissena polymorpha]